jgi:hypothetical protein
MTSILASPINSNLAHLRLWVLLLHFRHILLELRWRLRFGFHKVDFGVPRLVIGKHHNLSVSTHRLSRHWPNHIGVNQLKKSSLFLILRAQRLQRLPEHLAHDACLKNACRWALNMKFDTFDCIREPFDSCQREMAEASMPKKDILFINCGPDVGIGLGGSGNGARSLARCGSRCGAPCCARWIIYCYRGFRD